MRKLFLALLAGVSLAGCGGPETSEQEIPTFEEFQAQAIKSEENVYVVNGDEAVEGLEGLKAYYDNFVANGDVGTHHDGLAVYHTDKDIKWSATQARNLTYCVSSSSFGSHYKTVVSAMKNAAAAWEAAADVNFVHSSTYDSKCTTSQAGVLFDVRKTNDTRFVARAFFPGTGRSGRNVLISTSAFGNIAPWTLTGVLRHELGHVLGFRHEHTRLRSTGCYEDAHWRALTSYDSKSVMHYPQCNGTQTGDLVLTSSDKAGAKKLYP